MKRHFYWVVIMCGALLGATLFFAPAMAQQKFMTIGTGGPTGVYYVAGQAICRMVNRLEDSNIECNAPTTGGSVANINGIKSGELDMGVVQSDVGYRAYHGEGDFDQPFSEMRSVFAVHSEPLTLLALADSGIEEFDDLKGKRVNIGNPGSGQRATLSVLMQAKGWTNEVYSRVSELTSAEQASALADGRIDAMVYVAGHPNGSIGQATTTVDANLIPLTGPKVEQLIEQYPYYTKAVIPGGLYAGNEDDVETFGVVATLVTDADTHADVVYQTVKSVFENFDRFKLLHPAFAKLEPSEMISKGLSAPLHEGAARYYKERGWIE